MLRLSLWSVVTNLSQEQSIYSSHESVHSRGWHVLHTPPSSRAATANEAQAIMKSMSPGAAKAFCELLLRGSTFNGRACLFKFNGTTAPFRRAPRRVPVVAAAADHLPSPERLCERPGLVLLLAASPGNNGSNVLAQEIAMPFLRLCTRLLAAPVDARVSSGLHVVAPAVSVPDHAMPVAPLAGATAVAEQCDAPIDENRSSGIVRRESRFIFRDWMNFSLAAACDKFAAPLANDSGDTLYGGALRCAAPSATCNVSSPARCDTAECDAAACDALPP